MKKVFVQIALTLCIGSAVTGIQPVRADVDAACIPTAGSTAFESGSEVVAKRPMNLNAFKEVVKLFSCLSPKDASRFLIETNSQDPGLAETLLLYQRHLQRSADIEAAFLFYVINTEKPLLADEDPEVLFRLEHNYRKSLLLADRLDSDSGRSKTLDDLRRFGQRANQERYGRGDVIPTNLLNFDASADGYSHLNAVWMAEVSALAYWDKEMVEKQLRVWQYELITEITDEKTETNAYLAEKDQYIVLSFRGTSSLKDFITDVDIRKTSPDWANGDIHRGFARALDSVWPGIKEQLGRSGQQEKKLWVTGHSLGGALAQLAALRLTKSGYRVQAVYTFGTPRIGNKAFVADYDRRVGKRTFPHINRNDLVTRVPSAWLGYRTSAKNQVRKFPDKGHEMISLRESPDEIQVEDVEDVEEEREKVSRAVSSIRSTTAFLPDSVRPPSLASTVSDPPPELDAMNFYSNEFEVGPLDEHGSFEYLFKLGCVALEKDLWQIEASRAGMTVGQLDIQ